MMIQQVCQFLETFAPLKLAEDWDNVGLIVGNRKSPVQKVMTCLTVTAETADEAIAKQADLIVSHHPLPFRPIKKLTTDTVPSELVWKLARGGVSVFSPHTAFDSTVGGINESLASRLGVGSVKPLVPLEDDPQIGAGRYGRLSGEVSLGDFLQVVKSTFDLKTLAYVGDLQRSVSKIAFACGSGGSFLDKAVRVGCDAMVTGEATFHTALDARAKGVALVLLGHYDSERFAVEELAEKIKAEFAELEVWASEDETDPIQFVG